jgi:hypothetical protein
MSSVMHSSAIYRIRAVAIAAVIALLGGFGLSTAPEAHAESTVGGTITRGEVWERAVTWVRTGVPYSSTAYAADPQGKMYRTDCSGFVSMAWHLSGNPDTDSLSRYASKLGSFQEMKTGDVFLRPKNGVYGAGHVALFVEWANDAHTTAWIMDENGTLARQTTKTIAMYSAMGYSPYRYSNIIDDPLAPTPDAPAQAIEELVIPKLAVIDAGGNARLKTGALTAEWLTVADHAVDVKAEGERTGVLQTDNTLWVKEGDNGTWTLVSTGVASFDLAGDQIAVVTTDGKLNIKEGPIGAAWALAATDVKQVVADGDRVGMLSTAGDFYAKDGVTGTWVLEQHAVGQIAVSGSRLASVATDGQVYVKEGLSGTWVTVGNNATQVELAGDRIAIVGRDGAMYAKEGAVTSEWVKETTSVASVELAGDRIGVVKTSGSITVKEGSLYAPWTSIGVGTVLSLD